MTAYRFVLPAALAAASLTCLLTSLAVPLHAQPAGYGELAASQAAQNAQAGARRSPSHVSPVPTEEVTPQAQALIAAPYPPHFNADPKTAAEWKDLINARAAVAAKAVPVLKDMFKLSVEPKLIAGVKAYIVTPATVPANNANRLLVHVHGGGYVFAPGEAA